MIKAIIGIGNFLNKKNIYTRHDLGILFIKKLLYFFDKKEIFNKKIYGFYEYININNNIILIYYPCSLINESGKYINKLLLYYNILSENIIVVHDDMSFLPGIAKLKFGGSDAGHNGIKNIIFNLKCNKFYRIRIGIGKPINKIDTNNFVLSKPSFEDNELILKSIKKSINCIKKIFNNNIIIATNYLNSI